VQPSPSSPPFQFSLTNFFFRYGSLRLQNVTILSSTVNGLSCESGLESIVSRFSPPVAVVFIPLNSLILFLLFTIHVQKSASFFRWTPLCDLTRVPSFSFLVVREDTQRLFSQARSSFISLFFFPQDLFSSYSLKCSLS